MAEENKTIAIKTSIHNKLWEKYNTLDKIDYPTFQNWIEKIFRREIGNNK